MACTSVAVLGLHSPPSSDELMLSSAAYNQLPDDENQPDPSEHHLQELARLFMRYDVQNKFGLHLIHGHLSIPDGTVMFGRSFTGPDGFWTKPTNVDDLNLGYIHGHIFMLSSDGGGFVPYEYREGLPIEMTGVDTAFFAELAQYLKDNSLAGLLGLQALCGEPPEDMVEFVLDGGEGTVMLHRTAANYGRSYKVTDWRVQQQEGGIVEFKGGETHAETYVGTHRVFIDGKPLPDVDSLKKLLAERDLIRC
ncbi:Uncharacterized protein TPAR_07209 [Tolypocladium paradoxum]|uniref:Uncharacterized protein n=1 Tax=Tolypocladium paradoxum TaxID=94208 RepID=A0A2S4KQY0_9HYPO|nr:Uncharacterized protein TPAR_07209 [Tolypocladium paradoxum]